MDVPTTGLVQGLANEAYHAGPGLSHSGVKRLRKSPFHYHELARPRDVPAKAPTPEMFAGTLAHCALLEPDAFDARYLVCDIDKRTKAFKEQQIVAEATSSVLITSIQRETAFAQAASVKLLPEAKRLLSRGQAEVSAYWIDKDTGTLCKCRPDWVSPVSVNARDGFVLVDFKTTSDASARKFAKTVLDFEYDLQAAWYLDGYEQASGLMATAMVFAVCEREYPYACALYELHPDDIARAREANRRALALYTACARDDKWPGYPTTLQTLELPVWAWQRREEIEA